MEYRFTFTLSTEQPAVPRRNFIYNLLGIDRFIAICRRSFPSDQEA